MNTSTKTRIFSLLLILPFFSSYYLLTHSNKLMLHEINTHNEISAVFQDIVHAIRINPTFLILPVPLNKVTHIYKSLQLVHGLQKNKNTKLNKSRSLNTDNRL